MAGDPLVPRDEPPSTWERAKPLYLAALLAILTIAGLRLLSQLMDILILLFISLVLAAALWRPAAALERRGIPRGIAVTIVELAALAALLVVGWIVLPPLFDQAARFAERVPEYVDRVESLRRDYDELADRYPALGSFDEEVAALAERFGSAFGARLVNLPMTTATLLFQLLTIIALSTLMVMRRERIIGAVLPLVAPRHRPRVVDVYEKVWDRVGAYVRAKIIVMVVIGGLMYLCLLALDVPFAVPLSVIVAFGEVIPQIGPWIGRIPLLGVAALEGLTTMGLVFLASFILENLKAYVIGPRVEGEQLKIDPLVVLIAVLAGATLFGPAGALISVPFAAMLQLLYEEIVLPWRTAEIAEEEPIGPPAPDDTVHTSTLDL